MGIWNYVLGFDPKHSRTKTLKNYPQSKTREFHKRKHNIPNVIYKTIGNQEVIYGEHSLRIRFPKYLQRHTQDIDVYSLTPKRDALQAERALDHHFRGNFFYTKPAQHPGTYKVSAYANDEGYADFSKKPPQIPYEKIKGHNYVKLSVEKQHRIASLRDSGFSWRHGKDRDALNRMQIYQKHHRR